MDKKKYLGLVEQRLPQYLFVLMIAVLYPVMLLLSSLTSQEIYVRDSADAVMAVDTYTHEAVHSPEVKPGIADVYTVTLPQTLEEADCLAFYTKYSNVKVESAGELLYSFGIDRSNRWNGGGGCAWNICPLPQKLAGTELIVTISANYASLVGNAPNFVVGDNTHIFRRQLQKDIPMILFTMVTIVVGMVFVLRDIREKSYGNDWGIAWLGAFLILISTWKLSDMRSLGLLWQSNAHLLMLVNLCSLLLLPYPLLMWLRSRPACKRRVVDTVAIVSMVLMLGVIALQFVGVMDIRENLTTIFANVIICGLGAIVSIFLAFLEQISDEKKKINVADYGFIIALFVGAMGDMFLYYRRGGASESLYLTLIVSVVFMVTEGAGQMLRMSQDRIKVNKLEQEMARAHEAVMISQIQPHFLYNALNTIYYLCEMDSKVAQKAVQDFSSYLRGNLEALEKKEPVPVEDELTHTRHYLGLEKMRFGTELEIIENLECTDFVVPALTLQPIVENAVKYGWKGMKEDVKRIYIHMYKDDDNFYIVVRDNGAGFDPDAVGNDGRKHVGVKNVRSRVESLCKGKLDVVSYIGIGTTVTVTIPKEGAGRYL